MLVNDWMNTPVITIDATDSLARAADLMLKNKISMLPVTSESKLVGIVTDRDLKRAAPSHINMPDIKDIIFHLARLKVDSVMSRDPITVPPDYTLEETGEVLLQKNISGCPVMTYDGELIGIITKNDLFRALISVTGFPKRGVLLGFLLEDRPGSIKEVTDVLRKYNARLLSVMATYSRAPEGFRYVYIRAYRVDRATLPDLKTELANTAKLLYMVDLRDGKRETYASY
ncbi:MAG: CBS and ACT domain-containing protein [Desulfomonilaceae bacterium]